MKGLLFVVCASFSAKAQNIHEMHAVTYKACQSLQEKDFKGGTTHEKLSAGITRSPEFNRILIRIFHRSIKDQLWSGDFSLAPGHVALVLLNPGYNKALKECFPNRPDLQERFSRLVVLQRVRAAMGVAGVVYVGYFAGAFLLKLPAAVQIPLLLAGVGHTGYTAYQAVTDARALEQQIQEHCPEGVNDRKICLKTLAMKKIRETVQDSRKQVERTDLMMELLALEYEARIDAISTTLEHEHDPRLIQEMNNSILIYQELLKDLKK